MKKSLRLLVPLAAASIAMAMTPVAAHADGGTSYQATLNQLNNSGGSGMATVTLDGDEATVTLSYTGLATTFKDGPFPHVQHIHIGGKGQCPTKANDKNGDGVVSTPEGGSSYGAVGTSLTSKGDTSADSATKLDVVPSGGSANYKRTFKLNDETMASVKDGIGVVVVHGLDPSTLSKKAQKAKSPLVPELPLAATAPALCGALSTSPAGGAGTGTGSTAGFENAGLLGFGGLLIAGGAVAGLRRRAIKSN